MNKDGVFRAAIASGFMKRQMTVYNIERLERFANMVSAAEREECARVCDNVSIDLLIECPAYSDAANKCAEVIRARKE